MSSIGIVTMVLAAALSATAVFIAYLCRHRDQLTARYTADGEPLHKDGTKDEEENCFHGDR